jgi:hypothetical protein
MSKTLSELLFALNQKFGVTFDDIRIQNDTIELHWIGLPESVAWMPKQTISVPMESFINEFMGIEEAVTPFVPETEEQKKIAKAFQQGWQMGYKCGSHKL